MKRPYPQRSTSTTARGPEPPHGKILGYYVVIYDRHIGREIIIPASRLDIMKGSIRLP